MVQCFVVVFIRLTKCDSSLHKHMHHIITYPPFTPSHAHRSYTLNVESLSILSCHAWCIWHRAPSLFIIIIIIPNQSMRVNGRCCFIQLVTVMLHSRWITHTVRATPNKPTDKIKNKQPLTIFPSLSLAIWSLVEGQNIILIELICDLTIKKWGSFFMNMEFFVFPFVVEVQLV